MQIHKEKLPLLAFLSHLIVLAVAPDHLNYWFAPHGPRIYYASERVLLGIHILKLRCYRRPTLLLWQRKPSVIYSCCPVQLHFPSCQYAHKHAQSPALAHYSLQLRHLGQNVPEVKKSDFTLLDGCEEHENGGKKGEPIEEHRRMKTHMKPERTEAGGREFIVSRKTF